MEGVQEWQAVNRPEEELQTEEVLLCRGQAGDPVALERLFALHAPTISRLCRGVLAHAEDAEDAAQETFLRALRGLARFRGKAQFRTWLFRIALNVCLERKRTRRSTETWQDESQPSPLCPPEATALANLHLLEALRTLPPRSRAILLLKEREDWTVAEIAEALRCTQRRVYHELKLAHQWLADWRRRNAEEGE